jgi:hypothetical protein
MSEPTALMIPHCIEVPVYYTEDDEGNIYYDSQEMMDSLTRSIEDLPKRNER